jgi:hypothetical protein
MGWGEVAYKRLHARPIMARPRQAKAVNRCQDPDSENLHKPEFNN